MVRLFGKENKGKASLLVQEDKVKMKPKSELLMTKEGGKDRKGICRLESRIGRITWLPPAIFLLLLMLPSFASAEEQLLEGSKVTELDSNSPQFFQDSIELFDRLKASAQ